MTIPTLRAITPIGAAAIAAILNFERDVMLDQGYDVGYAQADLPRVVAEAIRPWRAS